jgi:DNA-binding XRE family transcriptional regulator
MRTKLKEYREKAGLTQEALAEKVQVARQTILFLEKAEYNPSLRLAFKISKILKIPVEELFSFDDE